MRCLIVTPVPTEPRTQGNAVLIARFGHILQSVGYHVHLLYSAMEGCTVAQFEAMSNDWDTLDVLSYPGIAAQAGANGYALDDWFDSDVGAHISRLCRRWDFDIAIVHYVWMSAVFEYLPERTPRVLFTHDRFGDRHRLLARAGIAPTWYSISVGDERRGLARADAIIAVEDREADYFRSLVERPVYTIGSLQTLRRRKAPTPDRCADPSLRAGYIASANPGNMRSILALLEAIDRRPELTGGTFKLVIAGPICASIGAAGNRNYVELMGIVDSPDRVYEAVDLVVNPSVGGSGLKIKSVEALASGMPLVATADATNGLPATHFAHKCDDAPALAEALAALLEPQPRARLAEASRTVIERYMRDRFQELASLRAHLRERQRSAREYSEC